MNLLQNSLKIKNSCSSNGILYNLLATSRCNQKICSFDRFGRVSTLFPNFNKELSIGFSRSRQHRLTSLKPNQFRKLSGYINEETQQLRRISISRDVFYIIPPLIFASFKRQSITEDELSLTGNTLPSSSTCHDTRIRRKMRNKTNISKDKLDSKSQPLVTLRAQKTMPQYQQVHVYKRKNL